MNRTLAKLIGHLHQAGQKALDAANVAEEGDKSGLTAFELEDRVLYSATPMDFADVQAEAIEVNEMFADAPQLEAMSATLPSLELVISTLGDANPTGTDWDESEAVSLGDPNLALGNDTDATFYDFLDLANYSSDDVGVNGMHAIQHDFTFNSTADPLDPATGSPFDLKAGDLIFSTTGAGTLAGNTTSIAVDNDLYVFRPDQPGHYESGEFYFLADNPAGGFVTFGGVSIIDKPGGISLPDGTLLPQGTAVFGAGSGPLNLIQAYIPETDTTFTLVPGNVFNDDAIQSQIAAVHVMQENTSYGGVNFEEGDILISLETRDDKVGTPSADLRPSDIGLLRLDTGGAFPSGLKIFDGSDLGLGGGNEAIDAITFAVPQILNTAPTGIAIDNDSIDENTDTSAGVAIGTLSATDAEGGPYTFNVVGSSPFSVSGDQLILTGEMLDFETTAAYPVTVRVTDSGGLTFERSLTIMVNNVNEAPQVALTNVIPFILEDTTARTKVADIVINDDALGSEILEVWGQDRDFFEIDGNELFLKANQPLDFETNPALDVTIEINDPTIMGNAIEDDDTKSINVADVNESPSITLQNSLPDIDENTPLATRLKVADIVVVDDALGTETLVLSGFDSSMFEIDGFELFLRAGETVDFETNPVLDVTVSVDDPALGSGPEGVASHSVDVNDVNEAPTVQLINMVPQVVENTTARIKVADIVVMDDALGAEVLGLSGVDSNFFEISGNELFLKAGQDIDFETNPVLDVSVEVDDQDLGTSFEDAASHPFDVQDVNEAPVVVLTGVVGLLPENTDTSSPVKVADILVLDDALGDENLILSGPDQSMFEIVGTELFLRANTVLDFETVNQYNVTISVDDPTIGASTEDSVPYTLDIDDSNDPATFELKNVLPSIPEDTTLRTKVADIEITDDAVGTNVLTVWGEDASSFEIDGTELYLRANAGLDFETDPILNAWVSLNDPSIGTTPEDNDPIAVPVTDVNEAPSITLVNTIAALPEDHDTTTRTKIADIQIDDDALGNETLRLSGPDASLFVIDGNELFLRENVALDFETKSQFDVVVEVDDESLGASFEDDEAYTLDIDDVNEAPSVALANVILDIPENTTVRTKVADIIVTDDALGSELFSVDGLDKDLFEVDGNELYLKPGQNVDFETNPTLEVTVLVDDPTLGIANSDEDFDDATITVIDVNEAPVVSLVNQVSVLPEDHDTSVRTRIADIVVHDDALGTESLSLSGSDSANFEIDGNSLYLRAGVALDFESKNAFDVTVEVDDSTIGMGIDSSVSSPFFVSDVNEAPAIALVNAVASLPENHDTSAPVKVADIEIADDALGTETLTLSGPNSSDFMIVGTELFLRPGTTLDFESLANLDVTVLVDDPTLGSGVEDSEPYQLVVTDENEAPTVELINTLDSIPEDTSSRTKIADIVIHDDALGSEVLRLTGSDANLFQIDGSELYLIANAPLDHETMPQLDVTIEIDDTAIGAEAEDSDSHTIEVSGINEAPHVDNPIGSIDATEDDPDLTVDLSGVFGDVDGDSLNLSLGNVSDPAIASASINGSILTVDFLEDQFGTFTIDIIASDGELETIETITVNVAPQNDAPEILQDVTLMEVYRDSDPQGELISDVIGNVFNDIDGDSLVGIAIVANDTPASEGIWQVKGSSNEWRDIGTVNVDSARRVPASSSVRFLPAPGFVGSPTPIEFVAIDSSFAGPSSRFIDVSTSGGTTPFSADSFEIGTNVRQFGVGVTPTSPMVTSEAGQDATFEVVLLGEPTGDVTIPIMSNDRSEGRPSVNEITFTPGNWSVPQTVTVEGINGFVVDGDQSYEIEFGPIQSSDAQYNGLSVDELQYLNLDDDVASVVISETSLKTDENGATDQFQVRLGSKPTSPVFIELAVSNLAEASLSSNVIEFTSSNWNQPQTITITGQNDNVPDRTTQFFVTATPVSNDVIFDSLSPVEIEAENVAAIGPSNPVDTIPSQPADNVPQESQTEMPPLPPPVQAEVLVEDGGVYDLAKKPRPFAIENVDAKSMEDLGGRFEANQYWRTVGTPDRQLNYYMNSNSISEQVVQSLQIDEIASMDSLWSDLDSLENQFDEAADMPMFAVGTAASMASFFTAGYLVWLIRGGWILAGVLSLQPMWSSLDMLAVLAKPDEEGEASESLEQLVKDPQSPSESTTTQNAEMAQVSV